MERSPELEALSLRMIAAMSTGDFDAIESFLDPRDEALHIGTDPDEVYNGADFLALFQVQQSELATAGISYEVSEVQAWSEGTVGWGVMFATFVTPDARVPYRGTVVFHLVRGQWRVVQSHASIGVTSEEALGVELTTSLDTVAHAVEVERPDLGQVTAPDGTVTLLFTDIEGSTERNQDLGDREWMGILRHHHDLIREQVAANQGFEVKSMGDGFMIAFSSARRALRCALDIQHAIAKETELDVRVRADLHAGEAVRDGDDFYGATVNMAARVAGAADGGEILVSSLVRALVESSGEFSFEPPRQAELNIPGTQQLHPVAV
jgi:class 3 adenylate cyclase